MVYWKRPDAHTWTLRDMTAVARWSKIAYAPPPVTVFSAIAYSADTLTNAQTARSQDGIVWTTGSAPIGQWEDVVWAQELGLFVAVANNSLSTNTVATSANGVAYAYRTAYAGAWSAIDRNGTMLLAVDAGAGAGTMTSVDGINWTNHPNALQGVGSGWYVVKWFAAGSVWVTTNGILIATSTDGVTWVLRYNTASAFQILSLATNAATMVALSDKDNYVTSVDGVTWTARLLGLSFVARWQACAYNGTVFCAVAQTSTGGDAMTSATGTSSWTSSPSAPAQQWNAIAWSAHMELFAALSINGTQRIMTSSAGS